LIQEAGKRAFSDLANEIINLDPGILSCVLLSDPQGSVLARVAQREFQHDLDLPKDTEGMAGHWAILAFNAMKRLDAARSKTKFIVVGCEDHKALIFPVSYQGNDLLLIMSVRLRLETSDLYERITRFLTAHP